MSKIRYRLLLFVLYYIFHSCVEGYDANTEGHDPVLVVEGLVTTQIKHHTIKLSYTTPFSQTYTFIPVRNALVLVSDTENNNFWFSESEPGIYKSTTEFSAETGQSYVLHIETFEGESFRSTPQTILPVISLDTLSGQLKTTQKFIPNNDGELVLTDIEGIQVLANIVNYDNNQPKFRFDPVVLVQYITVINPDDLDSPLDFCHLKVGVEDKINLTVPSLEAGISNTIQHDIAFIPSERKYYPGLYIQHTRIDRRALIVRQYSLSEEAYMFYKQLSGQLQSEGQLFDPVAVQLYGNMSSVNVPDKMVLGFFEASGYYSETFKIASEPFTPDRAHLIKVHDLDHLTIHGCSYDIRPPWWLY